MSGNNQPIAETATCPKCAHVNALRGLSMTVALTCKGCGIYFVRGTWNKDVTRFNEKSYPALPIGSKGKIDGTTYELMGFTLKKETRHQYTWREYTLFSPYMGYAFLSESDGHWNFVWPLSSNPKSKNPNSEFFFENNYYKLFQKYSAKVMAAQGEFFFDVVDVTETSLNYEYISPPHLLALESSTDGVLWCQGEYLTQQEVSKAFGIDKIHLPKKNGLGYIEPVMGNFSTKSLWVVTFLFTALLLFAQLFFNATADDKVVFEGSFQSTDMKDQKSIVTPSFEFTGQSKNVEIVVTAPINNDWFFAEFTLVNESSGTEYNFTKEVEYYHGYEDGESWTEGEQVGNAFLSQIPGGRYHINIYPEFSFSNHQFTLMVKRNISSYSNFFVSLLLLAIFPAWYFIRRNQKEALRWSESDYA